ncbi:hypothetical protein DRE_04849 [Drechslerella stenobrocha 248]|uniref:37S ribosomal protein YMR-31, mitochondrial n=1 Tax=Drechslerella stenobrocha 248 TaxID=1043628 RepID=W7I028_9PEZI|nr:hypothetical protein DRE_04849 [Drechslerella stenobrocha 248]
MQATRALAHRTPLIRFLGKRSIPESIDHTPRPHPASPSSSLPTSFKQYREAIANQHGPLATRSASSASKPFFVQPAALLNNSGELPQRFGRLRWTPVEMDAVNSGGASLLA